MNLKINKPNKSQEPESVRDMIVFLGTDRTLDLVVNPTVQLLMQYISYSFNCPS